MKIPETLNVDVYANDSNSDTLLYNGRLKTKLNVITDAKKIKEYNKEMSFRSASLSPEKSSSGSTTSTSTSPERKPSPSPTKKSLLKRVLGNPFKIAVGDSPQTITVKFIQLLALGPISESSISERLGTHPDKLKSLMSDFTQVYNPRNSFTQDDKYPSLERIRRRIKKQKLSAKSNVDFDSEDLDMETDSDSNSATDLLKDSTAHYILKDKSYKEYQPWNWAFYSLFERKLIQQNIHRALTRLGYSESHPLRRKICDENTSSEDDKKSSLGGGFLISKTNGKKSSDLPKLTTAKVEKKQPSSAPTNSTSISPVRPQMANNKTTVNKRKFSSSSISSSDEEKQLKKLKQDYDTSPSSDEDNVPLSRRNEVRNDGPENNPPETKSASKRLDYYNNLAAKFKLKYTEYEMLYKQLKNPNLTQNKAESKKSLLKLFELHNSLSQWKKTLWDYDNEIKRKSNIMNLSKHKKNGSGNATTVTKNLKVSDDSHGYQSSSPAPGSKPQSPIALRSTHSQSTSSAPRPGSTPAATVPLKQRPKFSLNY